MTTRTADVTTAVQSTASGEVYLQDCYIFLDSSTAAQQYVGSMIPLSYIVVGMPSKIRIILGAARSYVVVYYYCCFGVLLNCCSTVVLYTSHPRTASSAPPDPHTQIQTRQSYENTSTDRTRPNGSALTHLDLSAAQAPYYFARHHCPAQRRLPRMRSFLFTAGPAAGALQLCPSSSHSRLVLSKQFGLRHPQNRDGFRTGASHRRVGGGL